MENKNNSLLSSIISYARTLDGSGARFIRSAEKAARMGNDADARRFLHSAIRFSKASQRRTIRVNTAIEQELSA